MNLPVASGVKSAVLSFQGLSKKVTFWAVNGNHFENVPEVINISV
jgi:hypothetical protein